MGDCGDNIYPNRRIDKIAYLGQIVYHNRRAAVSKYTCRSKRAETPAVNDAENREHNKRNDSEYCQHSARKKACCRRKCAVLSVRKLCLKTDGKRQLHEHLNNLLPRGSADSYRVVAVSDIGGILKHIVVNLTAVYADHHGRMVGSDNKSPVVILGFERLDKVYVIPAHAALGYDRVLGAVNAQICIGKHSRLVGIEVLPAGELALSGYTLRHIVRDKIHRYGHNENYQ